jgi:hypothetical protein
MAPSPGVWAYPAGVVRGCPIAHLLGDYSVLGVEGPDENNTVDLWPAPPAVRSY